MGVEWKNGITSVIMLYLVTYRQCNCKHKVTWAAEEDGEIF